MKKRTAWIIGTLALVATIVLLATFYPMSLGLPGRADEVAARESEAREMVRDVRAIIKLALVQDSYEEYFSEKDSKVMTELLGKLGFKKKAMLRVRGRVTAGYQFDELDIVSDEDQRSIIIRSSNEPDIVAIEHDVDYLDLQQGLLNRFKAEELTAINAKGKQRIRDKAIGSDLFERARAKRAEVLGVLNSYVHAKGWDLVVDTTQHGVPGIASK